MGSSHTIIAVISNNNCPTTRTFRRGGSDDRNGCVRFGVYHSVDSLNVLLPSGDVRVVAALALALHTSLSVHVANASLTTTSQLGRGLVRLVAFGCVSATTPRPRLTWPGTRWSRLSSVLERHIIIND